MVLTVAEAAEELRISDKSVYRLISAGELQTCDVGTGRERARTRVTREALEDFIASRTSDRPRRKS
ncbi:helix-turn-helix domain-containing protein [Modestobacter sp. VKM Ac-2980]|uniref:helix-turn-helix domain-containing protein n=2 Tax=unclassified Modestobacter TaxID=2643866 RepID=UPI003FA55D3D